MTAGSHPRRPWPGAADHLADVDPAMADLVDAHAPIVVDVVDDRFEALCRAIVYQQLSGAAAGTIWSRLEDLFDGPPGPDDLRRIDDGPLADAGVSPQKRRYLRSLADHVLDGDLDLDGLDGLDDGAVVEELTGVTGIGRWTAQMFLIFTLTRPDVLPVGDLGLRKGVQQVHGLDERPGPAELEKVAEPWRPYRSAATWLIWRSQDGEAALE